MAWAFDVQNVGPGWRLVAVGGAAGQPTAGLPLCAHPPHPSPAEASGCWHARAALSGWMGAEPPALAPGDADVPVRIATRDVPRTGVRRWLWRPWAATRKETSWEVVGDHWIDLLDGRALFIPAGMKTDLASVPRLFWRIVAPPDLAGAPVLVHDALCASRGSPPPLATRPAGVTFTHEETHDLLRTLALAWNASPWKARLAHRVVRRFGPSW